MSTARAPRRGTSRATLNLQDVARFWFPKKPKRYKKVLCEDVAGNGVGRSATGKADHEQLRHAP